MNVRARIFLLIVWLAGLSQSAAAHPMGNFSVNHYTKIEVESDRILIHYLIDMAEIPAYQEMQQENLSTEPESQAATVYISGRGMELGYGLSLVLNGEAIPLRMISSGVLFPPGAGGLPTMKMGFVYEAAYPANMNQATLQVHYIDGNFPGRAGWKEIVAVAQGGSLLSSSASATSRSEELTNYPTDLLNSPPQALEATLVATLAAASGSGVAKMQPSVPSRPQVRAAATASETGVHFTASHSIAAGKPSLQPKDSPHTTGHRGPEGIDQAANASTVVLVANRRKTPRNRFTELIRAPNLSPWFLFTAAVIAICLGGLHALEPGHGKTVVAAYLVGSRGTAADAVVLGLIVTVSHTAGVFALGAITLYASRTIVPEQLYPWLGVLSGITIAALGCYMALRRLTGNVTDHSHLPGEVQNHWFFFRRSRAKRQPSSTRSVSLTQLLALGITGGVIPCPAALIVLLSAFALHRIALGFLLIVAFSLGLAAVLIGFGLLMVSTRRFISRSAVDGPLARRWLPIASSTFIIALGTALVVQAASSINVHFMAFSQEQIGRLLLVTGLGLVLGMRHSTDADHVVAISTIVSRQKSIRGAAVIGSVWGIGHTITIFIVGSMIILFKVEIPARVGLSMEFCVAVMLVLLGVLNLSGVMKKITRFFTPREGACTSASLDSPGASRVWRGRIAGSFRQLGVYHCVRPLVIGLIHGLAGSAAVALLVLSTIHEPLWATLYLLIFGAGTMVGMMGMTTAMAAPLTFAGRRSARLSRYLGTVSGMASLCFGSFLVYQLGIVGGLFTNHPSWTPR